MSNYISISNASANIHISEEQLTEFPFVYFCFLMLHRNNHIRLCSIDKPSHIFYLHISFHLKKQQKINKKKNPKNIKTPINETILTWEIWSCNKLTSKAHRSCSDFILFSSDFRSLTNDSICRCCFCIIPKRPLKMFLHDSRSLAFSPDETLRFPILHTNCSIKCRKERNWGFGFVFTR